MAVALTDPASQAAFERAATEKVRVEVFDLSRRVWRHASGECDKGTATRASAGLRTSGLVRKRGATWDALLLPAALRRVAGWRSQGKPGWRCCGRLKSS